MLKRIEYPRRAIIFVLIIVLCSVASFLLGKSFHSEAESVRKAAQERITVTAKVEERQLDDNLSFEGTVKEGAAQSLAFTVLPEAPVVTRMPWKAGKTLSSGAYVGSVGNVPIVAVHSNIALFRDLKLGDRGDDVESLQLALRELGYSLVIDGVLGPVTLQSAQAAFAKQGQKLPTREVVTELAETEESEEEPTEPERTKQEAYIPVQSLLSIPAQEVTIVRAAKVSTLISEDNPLLSVRSSPKTVEFRAAGITADNLAVNQSVKIHAGKKVITGAVMKIGKFDDGQEAGLPGRQVQVRSSAPEFSNLRSGTNVVVKTMNPVKTAKAVPVRAIREDNQGYFVNKQEKTAEGTPEIVRVSIDVRKNQDGWAFLNTPDLLVGDVVEL